MGYFMGASRLPKRTAKVSEKMFSWLLRLLSGCSSVPNPTSEVPLPPQDVRFEVRTTGGRETFSEGEPIGLDLIFTSRLPDRYELDAATYDRSGRLHVDRFFATPEAPDPLFDYFEQGPGSFGGIRQIPVLGPEPSVVRRDLAEHLRLSPGRYSIVVETDRVSSEQGPLLLRSEPLLLTVLPAVPEEVDREAREAAHLIDSSSDEEMRRAAAKVLRFLGTEQAAREMAARFGLFEAGSTNFELNFGLIGSPHRELVISLLQDAIADPKRPIDVTFVRTLSLLRSKRAGERTDAEQQRVLEMLSEALPGKGAAAKALSVETLQQLSWSQSGEPDPVLLREVFPDLPPDRQQHLLDHYWLRFADPSMGAHLSRLVSDPSTGEPLRHAAVKRLLELDPAEGRALVLEEIVRDKPLLSDWALDLLRSLPDDSLPEVDRVMGARLAGPYVSDRDMYLVERYATGALADRVEAALAKAGDNATEGMFVASIAYLLRVRPERGEQMLREGLSTPQQRRTRARLLRAVGDLQPHPCVEALAIGLLDDPSPSVAAEAAGALAAHGGVAAKEALWASLQRFHDAWAPRRADLTERRIGENPNAEQIAKETALWEALGRARGFYLSPREADRLASLVLSPHGVDQVRFVKASLPHELSFYLSYGGELQIRVAQYEVRSLTALRDKLSQMPSGVELRLVSHGWGPADRERAIRREIEEMIRELGHTAVP